MRSTLVALLFAVTIIVPLASSRAGLENETGALPADSLELVVIEADGCIFCEIFRSDVLPAYEASEQGKQMPVQFVDINDMDTTHLEFKGAVDIVPTFIVVKDRREVGRISGYVGPENFFHSINYLLASAP
jgi:thioredoxin-related protein